MKRNSLLAKSLTLGLAVATAAASMSVPGGLMAPEVVYAEEKAADLSFTAMSSEVYKKGYSDWEGKPDDIAKFGKFDASVTGSEVTFTGTAKYVSGFTGFNTTKGEEQEGYYVVWQFAVPTDIKDAAVYYLESNQANNTQPLADHEGKHFKKFTTGNLDTLENSSTSYFSCITRISDLEGPRELVIDWDGDKASDVEMTTYTLDFSGVQKASKDLQATVAIEGTLQYDQELIAKAEITEEAQKGAALKYQWYRVDDNDATAIDGATSDTYKLTATDIGKKIRVDISSDDYEGTVSSAVSAAVAAADARPVADPVIANKEQVEETYTYTLNALAGEGAKYAVVEGTYTTVEAVTADGKTVDWKDSPVFDGLEPTKTYTFFVTYNQDDTKYAKSEIKVVTDTVNKLKHVALQLKVTVADGDNSGDKKVTITEVTGAEYSFEGNVEGKYGSTNEKNITATEIEANSTITVAIRYPDNEKYEDVTPLTQTIDLSKDAQTAPSAATVNVAVNASKTKYVLQITDPSDLDGATAEYSLDGQDFTKTKVEIEAMEFGANETVNVYVRKAAHDNYDASSAVVATMTTNAASAAPTITGAGDATTFTDTLEITLTGTGGVYYTTDGSAPTINSTEYTAPFNITASTTVKAIAVESGKIASDAVSASFTKSSSGSGSDSGSGSGSGSGAGSGSGSGTTTPPTDKNNDGKTENTTTETKEDGTVVTTTETKAEDGSATVKVELKNDATGVEATVNVAKDAAGTVTSAKAAVTQKSEDKTAAISADVVAQITEAAGTEDVVIKTKVVDAQGNTMCRLTADAGDLKAGNQVKVLKYDSSTGEMVLVNSKTYQVDQNGNLIIEGLKKASYTVVTASEEAAFSKEVLKTVKAASTKKTMTAGKKNKLTLDEGLNMDNVAKITYASGKKSVATVSKKGTITAKKAGKVTIKATVTLKNGKKKTVKMTVTVKAPKKKK